MSPVAYREPLAGPHHSPMLYASTDFSYTYLRNSGNLNTRAMQHPSNEALQLTFFEKRRYNLAWLVESAIQHLQTQDTYPTGAASGSKLTEAPPLSRNDIKKSNSYAPMNTSTVVCTQVLFELAFFTTLLLAATTKRLNLLGQLYKVIRS